MGCQLVMPEVVADDLPPSAKACYQTLFYEPEPLTQKEITDATGLAQRTVRYALELLEDEAEVVETRTDLNDARKDRYALIDGAHHDDPAFAPGDERFTDPTPGGEGE